jgi:hypothetical protein
MRSETSVFMVSDEGVVNGKSTVSFGLQIKNGKGKKSLSNFENNVCQSLSTLMRWQRAKVVAVARVDHFQLCPMDIHYTLSLTFRRWFRAV